MHKLHPADPLLRLHSTNWNIMKTYGFHLLQLNTKANQGADIMIAFPLEYCNGQMKK